MTTEKIKTAAAATTEILHHLSDAYELLEKFFGRVVNGYGVFSDPSLKCTAIREIAKSVNAANDLAKSASWPSPSDYAEEE